MSDRSDRSSSLNNTIDAIGWTGFLQQASALITSSTMHTTDSTDNDGTRPYSEISATGPFYNWCFLQLCGVATDVGISLAEVLPLSVDQAFALTPVSRLRSLDPTDRATLVHRSALFLHGLYRPHSSLLPPLRTQLVYMCALAMTFLFQPEIRDYRMVREFQHRIGEFRPLLGLHDTVGDADCQQLVMDYFRMVYHHDLCYHTRFSILSSYATWSNEGRSTFISTPDVPTTLRDILSDSNGAQLRDNQAEYAASEYGHLANPCFPYIRQFQLLQPDEVRVHGCNSNDLALFFSAQKTFYRRCIQDLSTVTSIVHRKYHSCSSVCCNSHNPY